MTGVDLDGFFRKVAERSARVLLLDYDGTLAPFREERNEAVPYPGVRAAVQRILETGESRVVVVSGRAVDDVRPLLGVEPAPEIWGNHGWERYLPEVGTERGDPGAEARDGLERGREVAARHFPADRIEVKPVSVAVHTRGMEAGEAERALGGVRPDWSGIAGTTGLDLHVFDGGLELRVPGRDKGTAVREVLSTEPSDAAVAYLGDDRTDEDAFEELAGRGDAVLRVLVRPERRDTAAELWLRPPEELLDFLRRWAEATT